METDAEPQPNIMPNWVNLVEEGKEGLYKPEGPKIQQENPQNHLTWAPRAHRD